MGRKYILKCLFALSFLANRYIDRRELRVIILESPFSVENRIENEFTILSSTEFGVSNFCEQLSDSSCFCSHFPFFLLNCFCHIGLEIC